MSNYAVLGLGLMGKALCFDLLSFSNSKVFGFELSDSRRSEVANEFENFSSRFFAEPLNLSISDNPSNDPLIQIFKNKDISVVFGSIDYKFNEYLTKVAIEARVSFLDLGGNPDVVKRQKSLNEKAKKVGITIIPDCGLAPGMANIIAASIMDEFDEIQECHIRVGGLPQNPKSILKYQQVFSIRGLTNEYLENAIVIRNGKIKEVKSLTEVERLTFPEPWGELEAFQTAGGTSSLPELYKGNITELTYKTIRFPGHAQFFQFLKEYGLLSSKPNEKFGGINSREFIEYYLEQNMPKNKPDAVLIQIRVLGKKKGKEITKTVQCIDIFDEATNYSAMARTTSFSISIIGQMIMNSQIDTKGVVPGELVVPKALFLSELQKRNISFTNT